MLGGKDVVIAFKIDEAQVYYMIYCGVLDQITQMRDQLLVAKEQDYLEERKKVIQDCIDKLNGSIFDLTCAIELRKEGTAIEDKNEV